MVTKYVTLLAAGALLLSACQDQSDHGDVASAQSSLSEITHEPIGKAQIREQRGQLVATNMRTTNDGVRSLYQPGVSWQARLDWADTTSSIRLSSINSRLSGDDNTSSLSLDRVDDSQWRVNADFVSSNYRVNVFQSGELVGTLPPGGYQEPAYIWIPWWWWWWVFDFVVFDYYAASADDGTPVPLQACAWQLSSGGGLEVRQGNTVLRGDSVQIVEDPHESYGGFDEIQVRGNGDVTYQSESVVLE